MNTMINPELPQASREELLARIEEGIAKSNEFSNRVAELEQELAGKATVLAMANESLQSYKRQIADTKASVEALAHEHLDLQGTMFFDEIVDLFDIELTKYVTVEFTVSVQVQAQVPANMTTEEVEEELQSAKLDYEFLGNGDIEIEDFSFGDLEVE